MLTLDRKMKTGAILLIATCVLGIGGWYYQGSKAAEPPAAAPDGSIAIPADLLGSFDRAVQGIEQGQRLINTNQPLLEQIGRITLDRAGVVPEKFGEYEFDKEGKRLRKRAPQAPAPTR
jgi:hypothetical protein